MILKKLIPGFLKKEVKKILQQRRLKEYEKELPQLNKRDILAALKQVGVKRGDILFIHSSLKNLGFIIGGAATVIESLKEAVGEEGGLIFPTFSITGTMHSTVSDPNYVFDPDKSESTVGQISNRFRRQPNVHRSMHPTHSVAIFGKACEGFLEGNHGDKNNFGRGTPFGKFFENDGKVVGIGISYGPVTFYHVFEDYNPELFPGVYLQEPVVTKVKEKGSVIPVKVWVHNPEFHKNRIDKTQEIEEFFADYFRKNHISNEAIIGNGKIWAMSSKPLLRHLQLLYDQGITIYKTPNMKF